MKGVGETRFERQPDGAKHRGMELKVQVRALLDARSDELRASPYYKSPESIAAHELGHAGGLDDLETDQKNLMSHGREHDSREIKVEQLRTIVREFQKGHLNKPLK
jgi:predicted Zn-dependent protease